MKIDVDLLLKSAAVAVQSRAQALARDSARPACQPRLRAAGVIAGTKRRSVRHCAAISRRSRQKPTASPASTPRRAPSPGISDGPPAREHGLKLHQQVVHVAAVDAQLLEADLRVVRIAPSTSAT